VNAFAIPWKVGKESMGVRKIQRNTKLNPGIYARPDGKLQAHIQIPPDVLFAFGQTKRVLSLRTVDPDEANRRHADMVAQHNAAFETLRRGTSSPAFIAFAKELYGSHVALIDQAADDNLMSGSGNIWLSGTWRKRLDSGDPEELAATAGWAADWFFCEQSKTHPDSLTRELRGSQVYRAVLRECANVLKDAWRTGREKEQGHVVSAPRHPALQSEQNESADGNRATDDRARWPLSRYHEEVYLPAKVGELEPHTVDVKRQTLELFKGLIGDPELFLVSKAHITDFQEKLRHLPDGRRITGELKDKPIAEIAALSKSGAIKLPRQSASTIDKHVRNIKTVLSFANEKGHVRMNPTVGIRNVKPTAQNSVTEKRPFSRSELECIFAQPIYAGCEADTQRGLYRPGTVLIRDERFWIPVLLFLTGARASEVAGLETSEVTVEDEVTRIVFKHTPLRRLKNNESERVIPLHPWAMKMGFAEYVEAKGSQSTTALFPSVTVPGKRNENTGEIDETALSATPVFRQFNRTIMKHVGLGGDPAVSLHSFRHTFEDEMTGKDVPEEVMSRLTGRAINGSRKRYANSLPKDEERQRDRALDYIKHVEKLNFSPLNLSHLYKLA
jgi:integrase